MSLISTQQLQLSICCMFCVISISCNNSNTNGDREGTDSAAKLEKPTADPRLEGTWVQIHALAKEKPKGHAGYYAWTFKGDRVVRHHRQTEDGEPVAGSRNSGTYKVDPHTDPTSIDIILKSGGGDEDWKFFGIYRFEGDILKLCLGDHRRPKAFEDSEGNMLFVLKKPPKD